MMRCAAVLSALIVTVCWIAVPAPLTGQAMPPSTGSAAAAPNGMSQNGGDFSGGVKPTNGATTSGALSPNQTLPPPGGFGLTPAEEKNLNQLLADWEKANTTIKTFKCIFTRWTYDPAIVGGNPNQASSESSGELKYAAPDKGMFKVTAQTDYAPDPKTGKIVPQPVEPTEWWTCDGKSTYEVMTRGNQTYVVEKPLPPEMQGNAISDGPLPFVFGARADVLKKRYYLRIITPPSNANAQVWLEAFPKLQKDAANFSRVVIILNKINLQPAAIQIFNPGANAQNPSRTVITMEDPSINNPWAPFQNLLNDFSRPSPLGAKHVSEKDLMAPPATTQLPSGAPADNSQASRPKPPAR